MTIRQLRLFLSMFFYRSPVVPSVSLIISEFGATSKELLQITFVHLPTITHFKPKPSEEPVMTDTLLETLTPHGFNTGTLPLLQPLRF